MLLLGELFFLSVCFGTLHCVSNNLDSRYLGVPDYLMLGRFLLVRGLCETSMYRFTRA